MKPSPENIITPALNLPKQRKPGKNQKNKIKKLKTAGSKEDQSDKSANATSTSDPQATPAMDMVKMPELISSDEEQPT